MKKSSYSKFTSLPAILIGSIILFSCAGGKKAPENDPVEQIITNESATGLAITVNFTKGKSFNHPLVAIWVEDANNKYIETLYVSQSISKGVFQHGIKSDGRWQPGPIRRPAALPYWGHQRGVQAPDGYFIPTPEQPVADAITGPSPQGNFILQTKTVDKPALPFNLLLEINQSWDWNDFWTNNKYPDDAQYMTSSQPAVVYRCTIDPGQPQPEYVMTPVGHSHYSGKDGNLYTDLSTLTTALEIVEKITVRVTEVKN